MLATIKSALANNGVSVYLINDRATESTELYFIKKHLDMRRMNRTQEYSVTVYKDFTKDGKKMRGMSTVPVFSGMNQAEVDKVIKDAYFAAGFVNNPFYELPDPVQAAPVVMESSLGGQSLEDGILAMSRALFLADNKESAFINSAELFISKFEVHTLSSAGCDVAYTRYETKGEFVVQCIEPQDVEFYQDFKYDSLATEALTKKVEEALSEVQARAQATMAPAAGEYDIILSGSHVGEVLGYYEERSHAGMIYPKYSNFEIGTPVQGEEVRGEKLNIRLIATTPYSDEGIPMIDRQLVENGKLMTIYGGNRMCRYLNIEPTGNYSKIKVNNGSLSFDEMKQQKCLYIVKFSDFQMDAFSGHFAGEIRLAYLYDKGTVTYVTGGSINGNLLEAQKDLVFSTETYTDSNYDGPFAMKLKNINVAGTSAE